MSVFITGDIHGSVDIGKLSTKKFHEQKTLSKDDVLIILGDFGLVWENETNENKHWLKWLDNKPFTTLFVDGNHECFPRLYEYPVVSIYGAKAHKIRNSIYHICRGEILTINDKTFFCFGGAQSHDKHYRQENKNWWAQEMPSIEEMNYGISQLSLYNNKIDYVLTHCAPIEIAGNILGFYTEKDPLQSYFQFLCSSIQFNQWLFGHYHKDIQLSKYTCVYNNIISL